MKILITGGPVHAHIDSVKIITNKFRGGLMAKLADQLSNKNIEITYLTSKGSNIPKNESIKTIYHNGIYDYEQKVLELSPTMNGVVLGAAVANLIPNTPIQGKFPSHNYKEGDIIPIEFIIAPRIIDKVKKIAPNTKLFGFKLLDGVSFDELISAAYKILLEAKCTVVFANDVSDLSTKYMVTKERGYIPYNIDRIDDIIIQLINDEYYKTVHVGDPLPNDYLVENFFTGLVSAYKDKFHINPEGYVFGTIAVRSGNGFLTTGRGKNELDDRVYVKDVDHKNNIVSVIGNKKATLNAPLLSSMFNQDSSIHSIVHYHGFLEGKPNFSYAPAGTKRDANRNIEYIDSFNIEGHGCFILNRE